MAVDSHSLLHTLWLVNTILWLGFPSCFVWIVYFLVVRPLDRKLPPMQHYTLEYGLWFNSAVIRLLSYASSAVLQPYRDRENGKLLQNIVRRRFAYQDGVYGKKVNIREHLSLPQLWLCKLWLWYAAYWLAFGILVCFDHQVFKPW